MSILPGLPFILGPIANVVGGTVVDMFPRSKAPVVCTIGGIATALCVTLAILADSPYVAAGALIAAGAAWGFQAPAIPPLVPQCAKTGTAGRTYGVVDGIVNMV